MQSVSTPDIIQLKQMTRDSSESRSVIGAMGKELDFRVFKFWGLTCR